MSLIWGVIQLVMYVNRRSKKETAREIPDDVSPKAPKNPVTLVPWGGVDPQGNTMGGLAFAGQF